MAKSQLEPQGPRLHAAHDRWPEQTWQLKDAAGRKLVIFFYPKDMTSGCTLEAQGFRDQAAAFRKAGTAIVGISRDSSRVAREILPEGKAALPAAVRRRREGLPAV